MASTIETFFDGRVLARQLFDEVERAVDDAGPSVTRVTKSQIAFRRKRGFAWAWTPDRWLDGKTAPLVLSIAFGRHDPSPRWKKVVEPTNGHWMHHLEIRSAEEVDHEVRAWLREAWQEAG